MKHIAYHIIGAIFLGLLVSGCEFEKTENHRYIDETWFQGFGRDYFVVHTNSISYYSPEVHQVYPNIFTHQNGRPPGGDISCFSRTGLMSFEKENNIEFIDIRNCTSIKTLEIENPRDIYFLKGQYCALSYGNNSEGGVAIVDLIDKSIASTVRTNNRAGEIYRKGDFLYVFSDGHSDQDSIIEKFYYAQNNPSSLERIETFTIGIRPVDFVEMDIQGDKSVHNGLAILCKGDDSTPASIVLFDLIIEEVVARYPFDSNDVCPENLFRIQENNSDSKALVSNINGKLYNLKLETPVEMSVLVNKNISEPIPSNDYYLAVSLDTLALSSYLYRFDLETLDLVDSIAINPKATEIR